MASAPATYAEWRHQTYGEPMPEAPKPKKRECDGAIRPSRSDRKGRKLRERLPRPVRANHVPGGSRYCYALGCGHDDCYRKEHEYYEMRKRAGYSKHGNGWGGKRDPREPPRWFDDFVRNAASL